MSGLSHPPPSYPPRSAPSGAGRGPHLLIALVVVLVAVVIGLTTALVLVVGGDDPVADDPTGTPEVVPADGTSSAPSRTSSPADLPTADAQDWARSSEAASAAANQFVLRVNTYGPSDLDEKGQMPEYRDRVIAIVTSAFASTFESQGLSMAEQTVAEAGYGRTVTLSSSGTAALDATSAEVLVAGSYVSTYPSPDDDSRIEQEQTQFRYVVDVVLEAGEWLVDDFAPVTDGRGPGLERAADKVPVEVRSARQSAVEAAGAVLTYDYRELEESKERALEFLTPALAEQYVDNFDKVVLPNAGRTETVVTCEVLAAGVGGVGDDRVEVVLFMNRPTSNVEGATVSRDQATFVMLLVDGTWLLDEIRVQ